MAAQLAALQNLSLQEGKRVMAIPENIDYDSLREQLSAGNVAFEPTTSANVDHQAVEHAIASASATEGLGGDSIAVAYLDTTPTQLADLRDVAQDLQLSTTHDTVIVQAPGGVGAVSDTLTRAQIEAGQDALVSAPPETGVTAFLEAAQQADTTNWGIITVIAIAILFAAMLVAFRAERREPLHHEG